MSATWDVRHGDCRDIMRTLPDNSVDAIVSDPPYGLAFMGKAWDHGVPGVEFWTEALRVAKPGAHLVAFGGTRTFHRLAVAIEDAGWVVRDCLSWLYGSGFPKSHNGPWGGTALKPAWEPIVLARKPLVGTVAANVTQYGTGGINVDGCRIGTDAVTINTFDNGAKPFGGAVGEPYTARTSTGRWPANICLDEDAAALLDAQSGQRGGGFGVRGRGGKTYADGEGFANTLSEVRQTVGYGDSGGASRFFYTAKASRREREAGLEGMPKGDGGIKNASGRGFSEGDPYATIKTANNHPTVKPIALMRWLCRLVTPPNGLVLDPFNGSGSTGCAAVLEGFRYLGAELDADYVEIARKRIAHWASQTPEPDLFG